MELQSFEGVISKLNIGNRIPMIYVAGPYSAPTQQEIDYHVKVARAWAETIWQVGGVAICPHLNTQGFEAENAMNPDSDAWLEDFKMFLSGDFEIISRCDAVLFFDGWRDSKGAVAEFAFASYMDIPCLFNAGEVAQFIHEY